MIINMIDNDRKDGWKIPASILSLTPLTTGVKQFQTWMNLEHQWTRGQCLQLQTIDWQLGLVGNRPEDKQPRVKQMQIEEMSSIQYTEHNKSVCTVRMYNYD